MECAGPSAQRIDANEQGIRGAPGQNPMALLKPHAAVGMNREGAKVRGRMRFESGCAHSVGEAAGWTVGGITALRTTACLGVLAVQPSIVG